MRGKGIDMKVLVTGSRFWTSRDSIFSALKAIIQEYNLNRDDLTIIHGKCRGADIIVDSIAQKNGIEVLDYPANWLTYGNKAGPIRNQEMLDRHPDIDLVLAFHDNIDNSKGTRDMVQRAKKAGIEVRLYDK